jgi:multidrug efflux pump subunit AcrB
MILSLIVALTFTPALCATLLKQHDPNKEQSNNIFARFFRGLIVASINFQRNIKVVSTV